MNYRANRSLVVAVMLMGGAGLGAAVSDGWRSHQNESRSATIALAAQDRTRTSERDDTYASLLSAHRVERLQRAYGLSRYQFSGQKGAGRIGLDARGASFVVANSRNLRPTADNDCTRGSEPVNPYPLSVSDSNNIAIVGGIIVSRIPQTSDWRFTYCNSAALHIRRSPGTVVDGIRIAGGWDGIRASAGSPHLVVANSWLSDIRDDAVENDYLYSAAVHDTLIDGAFQGVSIKPGGDDPRAASQEHVVISAVLLRLREYPYRGTNRFGALTKNATASPALRISNSVVAVDYRGGTTWPDYWSRSWSSLIESRNNLFLWLSDEPIPASIPVPPRGSGFVILTGAEARRSWERARLNWINCHPRIARLPSDPRSDVRRCDRAYWGGHGH